MDTPTTRKDENVIPAIMNHEGSTRSAEKYVLK